MTTALQLFGAYFGCIALALAGIETALHIFAKRVPENPAYLPQNVHQISTARAARAARTRRDIA